MGGVSTIQIIGGGLEKKFGKAPEYTFFSFTVVQHMSDVVF